MSIQEYKNTKVKVGNWAEERAMEEALSGQFHNVRAVGKNSSLDFTRSRIFPNADAPVDTQYVTTHKESFRRENHVPESTCMSGQISRRAAIQRANLIEQAKLIHAEQKKELEARINASQTDNAENSFSHRPPMNRQRVMNFNRPLINEDPMSDAAISIYSEQKLKQSKVPLTAEKLFARNAEFTTPIEHYTGHKIWKE